MEALNGTELEGVPIDISLAKPQGDKKKMVRGGRGRAATATFPATRGGFDFAFPTRGVRGSRAVPGFGRGYGGPMDFGYGAFDPYGNAYCENLGASF
ncbi:unnamed protein product [Gongylonema pulchrum]|uniref:RRM domain-containing protein n=1 Tax=Gongylonema pulchrum TaxID=637853 RepID=A0A183EEA3_9BILA|nr:unnamed protein product [Gongylonema pulchrum]VDN49987.1 unnamed protein product [Gongylonema pulchrum]